MPDKHPAVTDRRRLDRAADLLLARRSDDPRPCGYLQPSDLNH
jgi:hypothetical protein